MLVIVSESVVPLYERVALNVSGPLGFSDPVVKLMPVPASGWLTSGARGWSVGVSPLKNRPVELTPELGMEAAKLMAALWLSPLEPRPKPPSPCAAAPGEVVVVKL